MTDNVSDNADIKLKQEKILSHLEQISEVSREQTQTILFAMNSLQKQNDILKNRVDELEKKLCHKLEPEPEPIQSFRSNWTHQKYVPPPKQNEVLFVNTGLNWSHTPEVERTAK